MKTKKFLASMLSISVCVALSNSAYAAPVTSNVYSSVNSGVQEQVLPFPNTTYHNENNVLNENNEVVGKKIVDTKVENEITNEGRKTTLVEDIKYMFDENNDHYINMFKNEMKTTEILITNDGEYFINDRKLNDNFLNTPLTGSTDFSSESAFSDNVSNAKITDSPMAARALESGGKNWLTYYTNSGQSAGIFYCEAYSDADFFMDHSSMPKIIMWLSSGSTLSDFKMYANNVGSARDSVETNSAVLTASAIAAGFSTLTPAALIAIIPFSATAYGVYVASQSGHSSMTNAFNLLYNAGGTIIH